MATTNKNAMVFGTRGRGGGGGQSSVGRLRGNAARATVKADQRSSIGRVVSGGLSRQNAFTRTLNPDAETATVNDNWIG